MLKADFLCRLSTAVSSPRSSSQTHYSLQGLRCTLELTRRPMTTWGNRDCIPPRWVQISSTRSNISFSSYISCKFWVGFISGCPSFIPVANLTSPGARGNLTHPLAAEPEPRICLGGSGGPTPGAHPAWLDLAGPASWRVAPPLCYRVSVLR